MPHKKPLAQLEVFVYIVTMETRTRSGRKIKMAASPGGDEDSVYDTGRLSLFDLILERTRAQNKVTCTKYV